LVLGDGGWSSGMVVGTGGMVVGTREGEKKGALGDGTLGRDVIPPDVHYGGHLVDTSAK